MADESCFSTLWERVKDYFWFFKAVVFTFGLFFGNAVVQYAFLGYVFVTIQARTDNLKIAALISIVLDCIPPFLASFMACLRSRFKLLLVCNLIAAASFIAGLLILWLKVEDPEDPADQSGSANFYSALALLVVGEAGELFMSKFVFSFIHLEDDKIDVRKVSNRISVWRSIARCAGAIVGIGISNLAWKRKLKISAIVMIIGYVFFLCGILYYKCQKKKRSSGETLVSEEINQLSQKCILRRLLKLLLLFIPTLIYYVVDAAGSTLFYEQESLLQDRIGNKIVDSASSLYAIQKGSGLVTSLLMGILVITKLWKESEWHCAKLILGMFVCFCCCMSSWRVESQRLDSIHKPENMSNLWTIPQFVLLGIAKELVEDGMQDVFFSHVQKSVHLWCSSFLFFVEGLGTSLGAVFTVAFGKWMYASSDESGLEKYYLLLAILTILAIIVFICLWKFYAPIIRTEDDNEGGLNSSRSHPQHPTEPSIESTSRSSAQASTRCPSNCNSLVPQAHPAPGVHHQHLRSHLETNKGTKEENRENMVEVKAASETQSSANCSLIDKLDTSRSSSSNSNLSVLRRSLTYPDHQSRSAANVRYQHFHTHPRTDEGTEVKDANRIQGK